MSAITGSWVIGKPMPSAAEVKDCNEQGTYVETCSGIYEITKVEEGVETFSTREEALLNGYFVIGSRIPVIGAIFSAVITLYSSTLSLRHICNSISKVIFYERNVMYLVYPSKDLLELTSLPADAHICRKESKSEAFSTLAKFHALNMCTLGLVAFAVASYSCCKKDD